MLIINKKYMNLDVNVEQSRRRNVDAAAAGGRGGGCAGGRGA